MDATLQVELEMPHALPLPGARIGQLRAVAERRFANRYEVGFEASAGSVWRIPVRLNRPGIRVTGAESSAGILTLRFPAGSGYVPVSAAFTW